jgi:hypothetical protein
MLLPRNNFLLRLCFDRDEIARYTSLIAQIPGTTVDQMGAAKYVKRMQAAVD